MITLTIRTGLIAALLATFCLGFIAPATAAPKGEKVVFLTKFVRDETILNVLPGVTPTAGTS